MSPFRLRPFDPDITPVLRIRHDEDCEHAHLALFGEFDLAGVDEFYDAVDRACRPGAPELVVDATYLTFCDSSGIGALSATARRCAAEGVGFRVTGVGPAVGAVFDVMQADEMFPIERLGDRGEGYS